MGPVRRGNWWAGLERQEGSPNICSGTEQEKQKELSRGQAESWGEFGGGRKDRAPFIS